MKKSFRVSLLITFCILFAGLHSYAQNGIQGSAAPKNEPPKPAQTKNSAPATPVLKQDNAQQPAKMIPAGSGSKPMDTGSPLAPAQIKEPEMAKPAIPPLPANTVVPVTPKPEPSSPKTIQKQD